MRVTHHYSSEGLTEPIICTLEYTPGEAMTTTYPGAPAIMEFLSATLRGHDISMALSTELKEEIEYAALLQYEEGAA